MKFPLSWLKELVDFEDTLEGLSDKLTFAGLEVEQIETIGGTFDGVIVGEIIAVEPHPNADKLRLCTVEYGAEETMRVVYAREGGPQHEFFHTMRTYTRAQIEDLIDDEGSFEILAVADRHLDLNQPIELSEIAGSAVLVLGC